MITDNSPISYPQPRMYAMKAGMESMDKSSRETIAIGEIDIIVNVNVNFVLE